MLESNVSWICVKNVKSISSKMTEIWHKSCQKQALFTSFRDFTVIFRFFWTDFDASKSVLGSFFAFFAKIWPKNMYRSSKSRNFCVWPFSPGDLRWPWPVLWSQSTGNDTYRCQWHCPCRSIGFVCALHRNFTRRCHQARKVEFFLLWPDLWRHQWPLGQIFDLVRVVHVQGYRMAFEIWKSVQ